MNEKLMLEEIREKLNDDDIVSAFDSTIKYILDKIKILGNDMEEK